MLKLFIVPFKVFLFIFYTTLHRNGSKRIILPRFCCFLLPLNTDHNNDSNNFNVLGMENIKDGEMKKIKQIIFKVLNSLKYYNFLGCWCVNPCWFFFSSDLFLKMPFKKWQKNIFKKEGTNIFCQQTLRCENAVYGKSRHNSRTDVIFGSTMKWKFNMNWYSTIDDKLLL